MTCIYKLLKHHLRSYFHEESRANRDTLYANKDYSTRRASRPQRLCAIGQRCTMRLLECAPATSRALLALIVLATGFVTVVYVFDVDQLQVLRTARRFRASRWGLQITSQKVAQWTWTCQEKSCIRQEWTPHSSDTPDKPPWSSLATCRMTCGSSQIVWPKPTGTFALRSNISSFVLSNVKIKFKNTLRKAITDALLEAFSIFKVNLQLLTDADGLSYSSAPDGVRFEIRVVLKDSEDSMSLNLETDESYSLVIEKKNSFRVVASITARTFFGARHGLETLSQLIWWDEGERGIGAFLVLDNVTVEDDPTFRYRGLMVDTSRNFMSVAALKRTIDGMAMSKLNVLHLHLTDTHSFPFQSPSFPQLSRYGAYSPEQIYTAEDIRNLSSYAHVRGVRLLPEMDVPAHAGNGWQWGESEHLGKLAVCVNQQPWKQYCGQPPCGQLNPSNNNTYHVLRGVYRDLIELTNITDLFHMGGDEINERCWTSSKEVFPRDTVVSRSEFWDKVNEFHTRALNEMVTANKGVKPSRVIVWSNSDMPDSEYLRTFPPAQYAVQEWGGSTWEDTFRHLRLGYQVILSHVDAWYFDCGFGASSASLNEPCGPVASVQKVYEHRPWATYKEEEEPYVLGGEACLWSEKADEHSLDSRLWPRAAALAERLWSDPPIDRAAWGDVFLRMAMHRERLVARGVKADVVWPQWCNDNPGEC